MLPPAAKLDRPADTIPARHLHSSLNKIKHPINIVRWTPEGRRLLTGSSSGEFTLWNGMGFNFETIMQVCGLYSFHATRLRAHYLDADAVRIRHTIPQFVQPHIPMEMTGLYLPTKTVLSSIGSQTSITSKLYRLTMTLSEILLSHLQTRNSLLLLTMQPSKSLISLEASKSLPLQVIIGTQSRSTGTQQKVSLSPARRITR